jgi:protein phosphatase
MPVSASQLPIPQKLVRALNWGIQLADGLAFMHQHGIGWQHITAEQFVVQERSAMWFDFVAACELVGDYTEAARQQAKDVTELTQVLYHLALGEGESAPSAELPPALSGLFERVLNDEHHNITAVQLAQELRFFVDTIRRPVAVRTRVGRCTDVGMVRDLNEDSLLTLEMDRVRCSISQPISLVAVADGMGGHAAGDVASGLAVDTLAEKMVTQFLGPHLTGNGDAESLQPRVWLESAVEAANQVVYSQRVAAHTNMGTTLVAAIVVGDTAHVGNVGDSRAYLINENGIHQITTDHSLVERLVALGHIDHEEARVHPQRNVIYRTLGDRLEVEADYYTQRLQPGDRLLLCSDGLTATVEDRDIWDAVMRCPSPQEACGQLVQMANDNGGQDNTTVIVLQAHQGSN